MPFQPVPPPGAHAYDSIPKYGTIFPSASRAEAAYNSAELYNAQAAPIRLIVNITVHNGGSLTVKVQVKNPVTGDWVDLPDATTAALSGSNQSKIIDIGHSVDEDANVEIASRVGGSWRVVATVATAAVTFSVSGEYFCG